MAEHAKFSPSKAARLIPCPGSYALESGIPDTRSSYADEGTGAHHVAAICLKNGEDADHYVGNSYDVDEHGETTLLPGDKGKFKIDASWAADVQVYIDEVRRRAYGSILLVEQRVEFSQTVGVPDQFGTSDAIIIDTAARKLHVGDLKFGRGVKVYASYPAPIAGIKGTEDRRKGNEQMLTYAGAVLESFEEALDGIETVVIFISQPRIDHFDEFEVTVEDVRKHMAEYRNAINEATVAKRLYEADKPLDPAFFKAGDKQCTFCKAEGFCPTKRQWVAQTMALEFDKFDTEESVQKVMAGPPLRVSSPNLLGSLYGALPMIESWVKSVRAETERLVAAGTQVIGPDDLPMKLVEGKKGNRAWTDETEAEAMLVGQLPAEKVYKPRQIITVSEAGKLLDKKKTAETWANFLPLIKQAPGRPTVVLGSDPRPVWTGSAEGNEFEDVRE